MRMGTIDIKGTMPYLVIVLTTSDRDTVTMETINTVAGHLLQVGPNKYREILSDEATDGLRSYSIVPATFSLWLLSHFSSALFNGDKSGFVNDEHQKDDEDYQSILDKIEREGGTEPVDIIGAACFMPCDATGWRGECSRYLFHYHKVINGKTFAVWKVKRAGVLETEQVLTYGFKSSLDQMEDLCILVQERDPDASVLKDANDIWAMRDSGEHSDEDLEHNIEDATYSLAEFLAEFLPDYHSIYRVKRNGRTVR